MRVKLIARSPSSMSRHQKTVEFDQPTLHRTLPGPLSVIESSDVMLQPISDLCTTVHQAQPVTGGLGFIMDKNTVESLRHRHNLYLVNTGLKIDVHTTSLDHMLINSREKGSRFWLSRRDRLQIAVALAWSLLQLNRTPWLKRQWKSSDINFHYEGEAENLTLLPKSSLTNPYLSWTPCVREPEPIDSMGLSKLKSHHVRNEPLLALGFVLVELCYARTLEDMRIDEDNDSNDMITRLNTAYRLLDGVYDESGGRYGDVVQRCLLCLFDMRDVSFDNEDFQDAVYNDVVIPLMNDLKDFTGGGSVR